MYRQSSSVKRQTNIGETAKERCSTDQLEALLPYQK
jgi:hypothetical protein